MRKHCSFVLAIVLSLGFSVLHVLCQQSSTDAHRRVIKRVEPQYPLTAKQMNLAGTVKILAVVAPDGSVKKIEVLGGSPILVAAAEAAVSHWKFAPGDESSETVELHFTP